LTQRTLKPSNLPLATRRTHTTTTNQFGLFTLQIGNGTVVSGDFTTINWGANTHYAKVEMDETGGTNYQLMGTSQLLSVPYALHAENVTNDNVNDADADPTNELQVLTISNDTIYLTNGGFVTLPAPVTETDPVFGSSVASGITGTDTVNWNNHTIDTDTQLDSTGVAALGFVAGAHTIDTDTQLDSTGVATLGYVAGAHTIEIDADSTNELQTLSLSNDTLNISSGNSVILTDADPTNELQNFSISGDTLFISNSNFVIIPGLFVANFVCGTDSVQDADGNWYQTVQISTQCWMAENLNVGAQIPPAGNQTNNGIIEKYCHGGVNATGTQGDCSIWGGLYQWDEMMQYVTIQGTQGICPAGFHLPTDAEWMTMEEALGMCSGGTNTCGGTFCSGEICWRGTDQGDQLKTAADCFGGFNCGISGFEALLAGLRNADGLFYGSGALPYLWSSTESGTNAWYRYLSVIEARVRRVASGKLLGFSVRCVKD